MSETTNDTNLLDTKKSSATNSNTIKEYTSKLTRFIGTVIGFILVLLLYVSNSSLILFVCKLAQSNILPTEANCAPYTDNQPSIKPSPIKTNIFPTDTEPKMSMKLEIPYDLNANHALLDIFKQYKTMSSSHFLPNYFIAICESMLQFNYSYITVVMNSLNSLLPESVIVGLGPIICMVLYIFGFILNVIYFVYTWFANMNWLFRTNRNDSGEGPPKWSEVTIFSPVSLGLGYGLVLFMTLLLVFWFVFLISIPVTLYHVAILSLMFYRGIINGKEVGPSYLIIETLKYYKVFIVTVISLFMVIQAFTDLGKMAGLISLATAMLIYFGTIGMNLYQPIPESHLSPMTSYRQATKVCSNRSANRHGFFYNMFAGQQGGGVVKDLKKIGKMMSEM